MDYLRYRLLYFDSLDKRQNLNQKLKDLNPDKFSESIQPDDKQNARLQLAKNRREEAILDIIDGYYKTYLNAYNAVELYFKQENGIYQKGNVANMNYCNAYRDAAIKRKCTSYLEPYGLTIRRFNHIIYEYQRNVLIANKESSESDVISLGSKVNTLHRDWASYLEKVQQSK